MAIKFTRKLILFSNTINNYAEKYNKLNQDIISKDRKKSLPEIFQEIQLLSEDIRNLQTSFSKQFEKKEESLSKKWRIFAWAVDEYLESITSHTYVVEDLIDNLEETGFWNQFRKIPKSIKIFGELDKITKKCVEKGNALNQLIQSGEYKA